MTFHFTASCSQVLELQTQCFISLRLISAAKAALLLLSSNRPEFTSLITGHTKLSQFKHRTIRSKDQENIKYNSAAFRLSFIHSHPSKVDAPQNVNS